MWVRLPLSLNINILHPVFFKKPLNKLPKYVINSVSTKHINRSSKCVVRTNLFSIKKTHFRLTSNYKNSFSKPTTLLKSFSKTKIFNKLPRKVTTFSFNTFKFDETFFLKKPQYNLFVVNKLCFTESVNNLSSLLSSAVSYYLNNFNCKVLPKYAVTPTTLYLNSVYAANLGVFLRKKVPTTYSLTSHTVKPVNVTLPPHTLTHYNPTISYKNRVSKSRSYLHKLLNSFLLLKLLRKNITASYFNQPTPNQYFKYSPIFLTNSLREYFLGNTLRSSNSKWVFRYIGVTKVANVISVHSPVRCAGNTTYYSNKYVYKYKNLYTYVNASLMGKSTHLNSPLYNYINTACKFSINAFNRNISMGKVKNNSNLSNILKKKLKYTFSSSQVLKDKSVSKVKFFTKVPYIYSLHKGKGGMSNQWKARMYNNIRRFNLNKVTYSSLITSKHHFITNNFHDLTNKINTTALGYNSRAIRSMYNKMGFSQTPKNAYLYAHKSAWPVNPQVCTSFFKNKPHTLNSKKITKTEFTQKLSNLHKLPLWSLINTTTQDIFVTFDNCKLLQSLYFQFNTQLFFRNAQHLGYKKFKYENNNVLPHKSFTYTFFKKVYTTSSTKKLNVNFLPIYQTTVVRFMEHLTGNKVLLQFYPFVHQSLTPYWSVKYRLWVPRLTFYETKLGHKFFLEESLNIIHLSFFLKDSKLFLSWLKIMILRISFWKTRAIFRFLKYLMLNFFIHMFPLLKVKGLKIRLKGKISSAGNSRKKSILYRVGQTSLTNLDLRVLYEKDTVVTFTGVMGLNVAIFY